LYKNVCLRSLAKMELKTTFLPSVKTSRVQICLANGIGQNVMNTKFLPSVIEFLVHVILSKSIGQNVKIN
jgi:hypothetical protein